MYNEALIAIINTDINRKIKHDTVELATTDSRNVLLLNDEQNTIYDRIMLEISAGQGGFLFVF